VSIDGRGPSLNKAAENTIAALKSKGARLEERVAVLTGVAQANADDRDSYMERCVELEQERDLARRVAIAIDQQLDGFRHRLDDVVTVYTDRYESDPSVYNTACLDAVQVVDHMFTLATDQILADMCNRETP
jgi:hypothetical protein